MGLLLLLLLPCLELILELREPGSLGSSSVGRVFGGGQAKKSEAELAQVKKERDFLKSAAAYFAKEGK